MAEMFKMMRQAIEMRKQMSKIQKELAKQVVEASSGEVTVVARGDMTIKSVSIKPEAIDPNKSERLEKMIAAAVNNALESAKKIAGSQVSKMSGGVGGLADMLGM
jgi:hypothetical protein